MTNVNLAQQPIAEPRNRIKSVFISVCADNDRWKALPAETQEMIIRRVERSCYNAAIVSSIRDGIVPAFAEKKFVDRYSATCCKILHNLNTSGAVGSSYLIDALMSSEIDANTVADMKSTDLCPEVNERLLHELELRKKQKVAVKVSRAYRCRKCGTNETTTVEYQSRCADEGSSLSIKCVNCSFVWRG
jgi:DNA-directed RNA polymerase subunit M/transcription elongation factor TFIIS